MMLRRNLVIIAAVAGCALFGYLAFIQFGQKTEQRHSAPPVAAAPKGEPRRLFSGNPEKRPLLSRAVPETVAPAAAVAATPVVSLPPAIADEDYLKILQEDAKKREAVKKLMRENPEAGRKAHMEYKKNRYKALAEYEKKRAVAGQAPVQPPAVSKPMPMPMPMPQKAPVAETPKTP